MTMKEMFKKVETYNEIAELMGTDKAKISFYDLPCFGGIHFSNYKEFSKYIRQEYIKEIADAILKHDGWEIDKEIEISYHASSISNSIDMFFKDCSPVAPLIKCTFAAELVA